jgi:hypothetical protein
MNKPITDITEQDGHISFTFMGGAAQAITSPHTCNQESASAPSYYTIGGTPVSHPQQGGIYLQRNGATTRKVFLAP